MTRPSILSNQRELALRSRAETALDRCVNKIDLPGARERWPQLEAAFVSRGVRPHAISALARTGLDDLIKPVLEALQVAPSAPPEETIPVYRPEPDPTDFAVARDPDGAWRLSGKAIERAAAMTYWEHDEAVRRFQHLLERLVSKTPCARPEHAPATPFASGSLSSNGWIDRGLRGHVRPAAHRPLDPG
jgi:hypothetical protein